MPGAIYERNLRLARAYSEGWSAADGGDNPHPDGTPEHLAWEEGYAQSCSADAYKGNDWQTRDYWCKPGGPGNP